MHPHGFPGNEDTKPVHSARTTGSRRQIGGSILKIPGQQTKSVTPPVEVPLLPTPPGWVEAELVSRKNRFHVTARRGAEILDAHSNNSGSMLGLIRKGSPVILSPAANPARKLPYTLEMIRIHGFWVGVNTSTPNRLLRKAWETGRLKEAMGYDRFTPEAVVGKSRLDALLEGPRGRLWIEAKNVTLVEEEIAYFPDAVTARGLKHLRELMDLAGKGDRVACFYLIQRPDCACFGPADFIDPDFANQFREALKAGVEAWPYQAPVSPEGVDLGPRLPLAPQPA